MIMKKHLLGFCGALFFAVTSFYVSPIRFDTTALGIGTTKDGLGDCRFYPKLSNHFIKLSWNVCFFETQEQTVNYFSEEVGRLSDVSEETSETKVENNEQDRRAIVDLIKNNTHYFCIVRQDGHSVTDICSTSYRHIIEFEQQNPH